MDFPLEELGLNEYTIGLVMRDGTRRACSILHKQRMTFTYEEKVSSYKKGEIDYVTSSDTDAQKMYVDFLTKNFPKFGIIAEEADLFTEPQGYYRVTDGTEHFFYFTVDPLDGTKAYKRYQSDSYSSMISLIHTCPEKDVCEVIGVCIGDPMTNEMYYTRPNSPRVHQLQQDHENSRILSFVEGTLASEAYVLLRDNQRKYSPVMQAIVDPEDPNDEIFKGIQIAGGSIGISFAKLWKGEFAGLVLKEGYCTVWDTAPVYGISKKLGFVPLICKGNMLVESKFVFSAKREDARQHETLVVHKSLVPQILERSAEFALANISK